MNLCFSNIFCTDLYPINGLDQYSSVTYRIHVCKPKLKELSIWYADYNSLYHISVAESFCTLLHDMGLGTI